MTQLWPQEKKGKKSKTQGRPMGMGRPVERTNSWLSNFGQLRRNTDLKKIHRLARIAFAVAILLTAKLIYWLNCWSRVAPPIQ